MADVFQQLKQKSGWGDLIDTITHEFSKLWYGNNRYMNGYKGLRKETDLKDDLLYFTKYRGKKITWANYKRDRSVSDADLERIKKLFIENGWADEDGIFADRILASLLTSGGTSGGGSTSAPPEAPKPPEAPHAPHQPDPEDADDGDPYKPDPGRSDPPTDSVGDHLLEFLREGEKTSAELLEQFGPYFKSNIRKLKNLGWKFHVELPHPGAKVPGTKIPLEVYKLASRSHDDLAWMDSINTGELARVTLLHRASLISKHVKSPLNEG